MKLYELLSIVFLFVGIALFASLQSCADPGLKDSSKRGTFEALWQIMDEGYCFFEMKGVDWNAVKEKYSTKVSEQMSTDDFFKLMGDMLKEVKDGHVDLISYFDISRYWGWYEDYPINYSYELQKEYLGVDYGITGGLKYKILDNDIGYLYVGSFSSSMSESSIYAVLSKFQDCKGLIVDIRDNGGGMLTSSEMLASIFYDQRRLVSYLYSKVGKGHNDFSDPIARYIDPHPRFRWERPVVLITNRHCYSAANDFALSMRDLPNVYHLGTQTGGGGGMPFTLDLPNGWKVRFSGSFSMDAQKQHIENGIEPDEQVEQTEADRFNMKDSLIEAALKRLKESKS